MSNDFERPLYVMLEAEYCGDWQPREVPAVIEDPDCNWSKNAAPPGCYGVTIIRGPDVGTSVRVPIDYAQAHEITWATVAAWRDIRDAEDYQRYDSQASGPEVSG